MKTETLILIGLALYFFSKKGTALHCPGSPGCPGYTPNPGSGSTDCPPGTALWTNYDPILDTFTYSCETL